MATQTGRTTCNSAIVEDVEAVEELINEKYNIHGNLGTVKAKVCEKGELHIWGQDVLFITRTKDGATTPIRHFLADIGPHLKHGQIFDLRVVGGAKARFPPQANRWTVDSNGTVRRWDLEEANGEVVDCPEEEIHASV